MDQTFHQLLLSNQALVQKKLLASLSDTELTMGQPKILDYLALHDGSNQKEISVGCYMEAGSLSTVLNGMESKGLITRMRKGNDKRSIYVYLTELGWQMQNLVADSFQNLEQQAFDGFSEKDQATFMNLFLRMNQNLLQKE